MASVARVRNYALKTPWVLTEAKLARDPKCGLTDPGIRTPLFFLFLAGFSLFEVYADDPFAEHTKEAS